MYELLIVSKIGESDGLVSRVEKTLKDANAQELKIDKLGKKVLAYTIRKQTEADYTIFTFSAEGSAVGDVTSLLRLEQETLLRYLILVKKNTKPRKKVVKKAEKVEEVKEDKKPKVTVAVKTKVAANDKKANVKKEVKVKKAAKAKK